MKGLLLFVFLTLTVFASSDELVVLLLDTSGSMEGQEEAMVKGTNAVLANMSATLKRADWRGVFNVQIYTFSNRGKRLIVESPLGSDATQLTLDQYRCGGGTPLYDVLGETLEHIRDNSTIIIATDGEDTTSERFSLEDVKNMMTKAREERDIHFVYVYKNEEAFTGGIGLGFMGPAGIPGPAGTYAITTDSSDLGVSLMTVTCGASSPMFRHLALEE